MIVDQEVRLMLTRHELMLAKTFSIFIELLDCLQELRMLLLSEHGKDKTTRLFQKINMFEQKLHEMNQDYFPFSEISRVFMALKEREGED